MNSKRVLTIHTMIFAMFAIGSLSSPFLSRRFHGFFSSPYYLVGAGIIMVATLASWKLFGGCPFTVWENRLREKEGLPKYTGSCLPQYTSKWFGLNVPNKYFNSVIIILLIIPILAGIL
ncbi:MAG: DUF2784 domain-containing protein [Candidatus Doudnabacteria bacterium]|nr:DUF2784 domain-containing protein [Candidatus Doudnabacteria bacterium]